VVHRLLAFVVPAAARRVRRTGGQGYTMTSEPTSDSTAAGPLLATAIEPLTGVDDDVALEDASAFERIVVRTRNSTYELVVIAADRGKVMVRGGAFDAFRPGTVAGSTSGGSGLVARRICLGCHLELHVGGRVYVTSRIQQIVRDGRLAHTRA